MNLNLSSFIRVKTSVNNKTLNFLIDTGADISIIKFGSIYCKANINTDRITRLNGIGQGLVSTIGTITTDLILDLTVENVIISHRFHVTNDDFPIPCDGIIGLDFIKTYNCVLDQMTK